MLAFLRTLATMPHLSSSSVMIALGTAMAERGMKYCCGNKGIANQLRHWVLKERALRASHGEAPLDEAEEVI